MDLFSYFKPTRNKVKPKKPECRLGKTEREILWTLMSFDTPMKKRELKFWMNREIKGSVYRLVKKGLIKSNSKEFAITDYGKSVLMYIASKGKVWRHRKVKLHNSIKLVAFDLDDTLIPGYVNKYVDVELMRQFLRILKENGIRTAVLSVNTRETIYWRLRTYGLLRYVDYPFHTDKGYGLLFLKKTLNLDDKEIIFIGHDLTWDYRFVKSVNPNIKVVLLSDSISNCDRSKPNILRKINKNELDSEQLDAVIVDRCMNEFIKLLNNKNTTRYIKTHYKNIIDGDRYGEKA